MVIVSFFSTSKGSIYSVFEDNCTQRFKTVDESLKEKSELTLYLNAGDAFFVANCLTISDICFLIKDENIFLISNDKEYGPIKGKLEPSIGLSPIEFWELEDRNVVKIPSSIHVGNEIDDIWKN